MRCWALGNTLTEYGMILGLLVLAGVAGLSLFGHSVDGTLKTSHEPMASETMKNYTSLKFAGASNPSPAIPPGAGKMALDPASGVPSLQLTSTAGSPSNATSLEGTTASAWATVDVAKQMLDLAPGITDPEVQKWLEEITKYTHYMVGAEGDHVGIDAFYVASVKKGVYMEGSSLRDIYTYQQKIQELMQNPPKKGNPDEIKRVNALAADAWNNAQPFVSKLAPYIKRDGKLDVKALKKSPFGSNAAGKMSDSTYEETIPSYAALTNSVAKAYEENAASGNPHVQKTLEDAVLLRRANAQQQRPNQQ